MTKLAKNSGRGSKPGERRGGRQAGTRNKRTQEQVEAIASTGMTPLDFLTTVYRDTAEEMGRRVDAAKAAAQYVHPKLSTIDAKVSGDPDNPLVTIVELVAVRPDVQGAS